MAIGSNLLYMCARKDQPLDMAVLAVWPAEQSPHVHKLSARGPYRNRTHDLAGCGSCNVSA